MSEATCKLCGMDIPPDCLDGYCDNCLCSCGAVKDTPDDPMCAGCQEAEDDHNAEIAEEWGE